MTPRAASSTQNSIVAFSMDTQNKQPLKARYFNIVQSLFTQQILQNKKIIALNSKIMYFFGSIFHGLKKGVIKSSLTDFMTHANKIFNNAKTLQIKEIIAEYQQIQLKVTPSHHQPEKINTQNTTISLEEEIQENNTQNNIRNQLHQKQYQKHHQRQSQQKINKRKPLDQISEDENDILRQRNRIIEKKSKTLERLGKLSNYTDCMKDGLHMKKQRLVQRQYFCGRKKFQSEIYNECFKGQMWMGRRRKEKMCESVRVPGKLRLSSVSTNHLQDEKLDQLNDRLEYYILLNKEHIISSRNTRQRCS